jgi:hypothetical protein
MVISHHPFLFLPASSLKEKADLVKSTFGNPFPVHGHPEGRVRRIEYFFLAFPGQPFLQPLK